MHSTPSVHTSSSSSEYKEFSFKFAEHKFKALFDYIPYGAENKDHKLKDEAKKRVFFTRSLRPVIHRMIFPENVTEGIPVSSKFKKILDAKTVDQEVAEKILRTVISIASGAGNCEEHANLSYTAFWRHPGRKELMGLQSFSQKDQEHVLMLLNRDPATDITDPSTWNNGTIIFDPWGLTKPIEITETCRPTLLELAKIGGITGDGTEEDIIITPEAYRYDPLSEKELEFIYLFLDEVIEVLKKQGRSLFEAAVLSSGWKDMDIKKKDYLSRSNLKRSSKILL